MHCGTHLQSVLRRYREEDQAFKVNLGYGGTLSQFWSASESKNKIKTKETKNNKRLRLQVVGPYSLLNSFEELSAYPETVLSPSSRWSVVSLKSLVIQSCPDSLP